MMRSRGAPRSNTVITSRGSSRMSAAVPERQFEIRGLGGHLQRIGGLAPYEYVVQVGTRPQLGSRAEYVAQTQTGSKCVGARVKYVTRELNSILELRPDHRDPHHVAGLNRKRAPVGRAQIDADHGAFAVLADSLNRD